MQYSKAISKQVLFFISIFVLVFLSLTGCEKNKRAIGPIFTNEVKCAEMDSIGVWKHLGLSGKNVTAIAVHPEKPNVIFAGTGPLTPGELFVSIDCGKSWTKILDLESSIFKFTDIKFDPDNPNIVYATPLPIIKSTDGGIHWKEITKGMRVNWETRVSTIAIDPKDSKILYAGTAGYYGGSLYKSTDGGENWEDIAGEDNVYDPGDPDIVRLKSGVTAIAIDPSNSKVIYAGTAQLGDVLKSTDGGNSWKLTGLKDKGIINSLIINPQNSNEIVAATWAKGFYKSLDGGNSWYEFNEGLPDSILGMKIIMDPITLEYYAVITKGDEGGIYYRKNNLNIWEKIGIEEVKSSYYYTSLIISPDLKYLYFGSNLQGIFRMRLR